jgi:hypothetical protein
MSFTKYPINPMTANPTATALQIWRNSAIMSGAESPRA